MLVMTKKETERKTLREWRLARDMTVEELAAAAGVSKSTVWGAEYGQYSPRLSTLLRLAKALEVAQDQIIWPEDSMRPAPNKGVRRGPKRRTEEDD